MEKTNEQKHRELWRWLAEHPDKTKYGYFFEKNIRKGPRLSCYACEEAGDDCDKCPLDEKVIGCDGGLYNDWLFEKDLDKRAALATKIAELPWRSI